MTKFFFRLKQFFRFYSTAVTKYQLHSPFVFEMAEVILDDKRWYYAFRDVERIRHKMLTSSIVINVEDFGTGQSGPVPVRNLVRRAASSTRQGRRLFRLANWANPGTILELGTSVGIGTMYLSAGAASAKMITLEGSAGIAGVAQVNLELAGLNKQVEILEGPFDQTLQPALKKLQTLDFVFIDGNHRQKPTLDYFETCLQYAHAKTIFVFDDMHWSGEMAAAWKQIQQHARVTLTVDFFGFSLAFINPDFKQKQHLSIVPAYWKIWKFF